MTTKVICFASSKGGSGKTVTSASLGHFLSYFKKKILLIDTDAATNGLTLLFLNELVEYKKSLDKQEKQKHLGIFENHDVIGASFFQINSSMYLIPATYTLKQTEQCSHSEFENTLTTTLKLYKDDFDYIILDAQAGSDEFARISISHSDTTIIVSEYDPISAEGVERLKRIFSNELSYDNTWVLLNKVLPEFSKSLTKYLSIFRFLSPIPWDAEVIRSFAARKLCVNMDNVNDYTLAILKITQTLFGTDIENQVESWLESKESSIREPAKKQLDDTEQRIVEIEKAMLDAEYCISDIHNKSKRIAKMTGTVMASTAIGIGASLFATKGYDFITNDMSLIISVAATIPVIMFAMKELIDKFMSIQYREKTKSLEEMNLVYKRKLDELRQHKARISTILESDIESLLLKKR